MVVGRGRGGATATAPIGHAHPPPPPPPPPPKHQHQQRRQQPLLRPLLLTHPQPRLLLPLSLPPLPPSPPPLRLPLPVAMPLPPLLAIPLLVPPPLLQTPCAKVRQGYPRRAVLIPQLEKLAVRVGQWTTLRETGALQEPWMALWTVVSVAAVAAVVVVVVVVVESWWRQRTSPRRERLARRDVKGALRGSAHTLEACKKRRNARKGRRRKSAKNECKKVVQMRSAI